MEALEKPLSKPRKKKDKQKENKRSAPTQRIEPVAGTSKDINVSEELASAANDMEGGLLEINNCKQIEHVRENENESEFNNKKHKIHDINTKFLDIVEKLSTVQLNETENIAEIDTANEIESKIEIEDNSETENKINTENIVDTNTADTNVLQIECTQINSITTDLDIKTDISNKVVEAKINLPIIECSVAKNNCNDVINKNGKLENITQQAIGNEFEHGSDECKTKSSVAVGKKMVEDGKREKTAEKLLLINIKPTTKEQESKQLEKLKSINLKSCSAPPMELYEAELTKMKPFTESQLSALYTNPELEALDKFCAEFIEAELKGLAVKHHPLYEMLMSYLQVKMKLKSTSLEVKHLRKDYGDLQTQLWTVFSSVATGRAQCQDGKNLVATHTYQNATFNRAPFKTLQNMIGKIRELTNETYTLYNYSTEVLKLQIDVYIQGIINNIVNITQLKPDAKIYLGMQAPSPHVLPYLSELRLCISVLFLYQRKLIRDKEFVSQSREWLSQLVFLLLRLSSWQDHLFILNHVLRCQAGVADWATNFIQAPLGDVTSSPFANYEVNHILASLGLILMPIQKREEFLKEICQEDDSVVEALWVVVDSDGEEDDECGLALKENDLVALLNQLPLEKLFLSALLIDEDKKMHKTDITEQHILQYLSFSTNILKILHGGLKTYNQPRYYQFCKRLSRFIRHVVQYATDQWELFQSRSQLDRAAMLRLQLEYDAFFVKAIYYLYTSEKLGAWQFLAVVPYNMVSEKILWKIFNFLHELNTTTDRILDFDDSSDQFNMADSATRDQFEEKLSSLADDECYYLLNTFANMALARKADEMTFVYTATMDLLQIGFISETTQEMCSKNARILLTHITSRYPHLLSDILQQVKKNMTKIGTLCLYLYEELPIAIWRPSPDDVDVISTWLLQNGFISNESKLARMILARLNWELVEDGVLFLPYSLHSKTAMLIARSVQLDAAYQRWAWQTAFRLRLHITDKGITDFQMVKEIEYYDVIYKGVREQEPLAAFLAVLISTWGHLIPLVCTKGLDQLLFLLSQQKHEAVLFALNLIVPLFINCQESIINMDKFQGILIGLLNADRTYINIAKSLVVAQSTVLQQFGNMIESHIVNYTWYGLETPRCLARLWVNSLVSVPNWNRDYGVMYLLDVIIRASFFHGDTMAVITNILKDLLQCVTPQEQSNSISSLFKWVSQSGGQNNLLNTSLSTTPYLAFVMINLEFEERENATRLWEEILTQLKLQKGKVNVDVAIKKATTKLKVASFYSGSLCLYRWAQQALDTPQDHPILVLLWQKFFSLYLYRVPTTMQNEKCCVGDKFFDGMINFNFLKRLKKCLQESVDYYKLKTTENDFQHIPAARQLYFMSLLKTFTAYSLWLEEPQLQESSLYMPGLPPQYEPALLKLIIQCSKEPWMEYVDYETIKSQQELCIKTWKSANYRERQHWNQPLANPGSGVESGDPWVRILRRLKSYDAPSGVPVMKLTQSLIPHYNIEHKKDTFKSIQGHLSTLMHFARNHAVNVSDHKSLDCNYQELLPQLYRVVSISVRREVRCSGSSDIICAGGAIITINANELRLSDHIDDQIKSNRTDYETLLAKIMQTPSHSLCLASVALQQLISELQRQREFQPAAAELGVDMFYHIQELITILDESISTYLPTKKFFSDCLEKLGQSHISGVEFETPRLLNTILEKPACGVYLAPHFTPVNIGTANFLLMYSMISKGINQEYDVLHALLSKFDINGWLQHNNPKLVQRSQFIELILTALKTLGQEPPKESLSLHKLYRKHLIWIFQYQFPEHYGEVLVHMLKASNGGDLDCIAISVWLDILNCLSSPIKLEINVKSQDQLKQYAQHQKVLHYQELLDTVALLSRHFSSERLQYGLYGLYPKAQKYIDVFTLLLGMSGHNLIIAAVNTHQGILGDKICEIIWPYLRDMFAPWLVPYWTNTLKENMAAWIQQLTDDRVVVLPWIPANVTFAQKVVDMFYECIMFIIQTLPACNNILSFVWHWYVTNYAHAVVKDHVRTVIHESFVTLPWHKFWPTIADLELMLRVVNEYLPECHTFLSHIFMEIPWQLWLTSLSEHTSAQIRFRIHQCLLNLLVKLSIEPNIRVTSAEKVRNLLLQAEYFDWSILDVNAVEQVMDWYIMSCDPLVLFKTDPSNLDCRIIHFLRGVCFYTSRISHPDQIIRKKRQIFARSYIKLVVVFINRQKSTVVSKESELARVVNTELNHMEATVDSYEEMTVLITEILLVLNQAIIRRKMLDNLEQWVAGKEGDSSVIKAILQVLGSSVNDAESVAVLYEACINSYFNNNVSNLEHISWQEVGLYFNSCYPKQSILIEAMLSRGCILSLHVLLLKKIEGSQDYKMLLGLIFHWVHNMKVVESIESKVPLIWADYLSICVDYCKKDQTSASAFLNKFAQYLLELSEQKDSLKWGGLLGAIGIGKQSTVSLQFRFLCRALAGYILAQLPDTKGNPQTVRCEPNAACTVGQVGGNSDVPKVLLKLDFGQSQGKIKECAEKALKQIQDSQNSIHNVKAFLSNLLIHLYSKPYLKDI